MERERRVGQGDTARAGYRARLGGQLRARRHDSPAALSAAAFLATRGIVIFFGENLFSHLRRPSVWSFLHGVSGLQVRAVSILENRTKKVDLLGGSDYLQELVKMEILFSP